ncbi:Uncharacterised protein [Chlamydia trachomatis]|nr:Uncharacterised protein [Chlamydia trachomatis]
MLPALQCVDEGVLVAIEVGLECAFHLLFLATGHHNGGFLATHHACYFACGAALGVQGVVVGVETALDWIMPLA